MHCVIGYRAESTRLLGSSITHAIGLYRALAGLLMQVGFRPLRVFEIVFGVVKS